MIKAGKLLEKELYGDKSFAILGNKGGSKMLGPGESRSLGHKVLFKGVPPAPALSQHGRFSSYQLAQFQHTII